MNRYSTYKKQSGIATVLIILLVGVALSASTLGVIYTVRSTQDKQVTAHATTNAQAAAWALTEAARNHILNFAQDGSALGTYIASLPQEIKIADLNQTELAHLERSKINIVRGTDNGDGTFNFLIDVTAQDSVSQSTAAVQSVFTVTPGFAPPPCPPAVGGNQFTGDIDSTNMDIYISGDGNKITVDGSYGTDGNLQSIHNIKYFEVTGDINLAGTSGSDVVELIKANGNITINGGTNVKNLESGKSITVSASANTDLQTVIAAGDIKWASHQSSTKMHAGVYIEGQGYLPLGGDDNIQGTIIFDQKGVNHPELAARGSITIPSFVSTITDIESMADINIQARGQSPSELSALGDISCFDALAVTDIFAGGSINNCVGTNASSGLGEDNPILIEAGNSSAVTLDKFTPVELARSLMADADNYPANYAFSINENGEIEVKVRNVKGLDDTTYIYYNDYSLTPPVINALRLEDAAPSQDDFRICDKWTASQAADQECIKIKDERILAAPDWLPQDANGNPIVQHTIDGLENEDGVIEIAPPDGRWEITDKTESLAPGVYYFDRDLRLKPVNRAEIAASFLSAGDIQLIGEPYLFALNYFDKKLLCENQKFSVEALAQRNADNTVAPTVTESYDASAQHFPLRTGMQFPMPTNFCDEATGELITPKPQIGNFAIMAGQENILPPLTEGGDVVKQYQGGNFYSQTSAFVFGRVIAGNAVKIAKGANIAIFGTIGSEARGEGKSEAKNVFTGTMDVHSEYAPRFTDSTNDDGGQNTTACTQNSASPSATLLWSGYGN